MRLPSSNLPNSSTTTHQELVQPHQTNPINHHRTRRGPSTEPSTAALHRITTSSESKNEDITTLRPNLLVDQRIVTTLPPRVSSEYKSSKVRKIYHHDCASQPSFHSLLLLGSIMPLIPWSLLMTGGPAQAASPTWRPSTPTAGMYRRDKDDVSEHSECTSPSQCPCSLP